MVVLHSSLIVCRMYRRYIYILGEKKAVSLAAPFVLVNWYSTTVPCFDPTNFYICCKYLYLDNSCVVGPEPTFCPSGTGTGMYSGSGTGLGSEPKKE